MGRPTLLLFCFSGSMPSALTMVAMKSAGLTGFSLTSMPSGVVLP